MRACSSLLAPPILASKVGCYEQRIDCGEIEASFFVFNLAISDEIGECIELQCKTLHKSVKLLLQETLATVFAIP